MYINVHPALLLVYFPSQKKEQLMVWLIYGIEIVVSLVCLAIVVVVILAACKPDIFRMQRSGTIKADPAKIFPLINDFHNWAAWTPWDKLDPAMSKTISGAPQGKGAIYEWSGNSKAGQGRMEITDSVEPSKIMIDLAFLKPFKANNVAEFTLAPKADATEVTWAMSGKMNFVMKIFHVFCNMDKMVGKDFEEGLANMRAVAEK
jgi:hypothetical protein